MPHNLKQNRHKRQILPRQGRQLQASTGVGHRDLVVQRKKWMFFTQVPFDNATGSLSFGLRNINVATSQAGIASAVYSRLMDQMSEIYEEYRVQRLVVHMQPGQGFTNDDRIKSSLFARVDVNSQPTGSTLDNLNTLICSEASVNKTFTERSNVKLLDFRPICFSTGGTGSASRPILPSGMQWYNIDERSAHLWRGATVAPVIPEVLQPGEKAVTVWADVEIAFRGRRPDFSSFSVSAINPCETLPSIKEHDESGERKTEEVVSQD